MQNIVKLCHHHSYASYQLSEQLIPECVPDFDKYYNLGKNVFMEKTSLRTLIPLEYAPFNMNSGPHELLYLDTFKKLYTDAPELSKSHSLITELILRHPLWKWDWKVISGTCNYVDYRLFNNIDAKDLDIHHLAKYSPAVLDNNFRHRSILPEEQVMTNEHIEWETAQKMNSPVIHFAGNPNMTLDIFKNNKIFQQPDAVKILINNPVFSVRELSIATGIDQKTLINEIDDPIFETVDQLIQAIHLGHISPDKVAKNFMMNDEIFLSIPDQLLPSWKKLIYNTGITLETLATILANSEVKSEILDQTNQDIIDDYAQIMQHGSRNLLDLNKQVNKLMTDLDLEQDLDNMVL
jgi:hypothetical protein